MKQLPLSNGQFALVDDCDFNACLAYIPWHLGFDTYPRAQKGHGRDNRSYIHLHTLIAQRMGITGKPDHKDRNRLNCQRSNLRPATDSQNQGNKGIQVNNTTGFKGVTYRAARGRYEAAIGKGETYRFLGHFKCPIKAALAYNTAATELFGEFAVLNEIPK